MTKNSSQAQGVWEKSPRGIEAGEIQSGRNSADGPIPEGAGVCFAVDRESVNEQLLAGASTLPANCAPGRA